MCNAKNQTEVIVHDRGLFYALAYQVKNLCEIRKR